MEMGIPGLYSTIKRSWDSHLTSSPIPSSCDPDHLAQLSIMNCLFQLSESLLAFTIQPNLATFSHLIGMWAHI